VTIQIEEGKYYRRADGSVHGPATRTGTTKHYPTKRYPWTIDGHTYTDEGQFYYDQATNLDLVAEFGNPVIETTEGPQVAEKPEWAAAVEAEAAEERTCAHRMVGLNGICVMCGAFIPESLVEQGFDDAPDIKATIADEAKRIVSGARRSAYGKPEQNFSRIAAMWTAYAKAKGWPIEFTARDVSPMMVLMKLARIVETEDHYDSWVDLVGYSLTGAEVNGVSKPA